MAKVKISARYVGRAAKPVEWEAIERIFEAVWGSAWRTLPQYPEVIGGVWANWQDSEGRLHEADTLDEVREAYNGFETGRINIYGHGKDVPHTNFVYLCAQAYVSLKVAPGQAEVVQSIEAAVRTEFPLDPQRRLGKRVFIVHGHDEAARESTGRFLEHLGLTPIILHEQASGGRTIIEKLEHYGDVDFAVVLLTADDIGGKSSEDLRPRARQNVIWELGYFVARLGRGNVCALHKTGVELPSDFHGVVYVPLDDRGAWKTELARELRAAGFAINGNALV